MSVAAALANGVDARASEDSEMEMDEAAPPAESEPFDEAENAEPSFGSLLAAKSSNLISIGDAFPSIEPGALIPTESGKPVAIPSGISLSTVLSQALRTNDNNLLESCFHNTDIHVIRSTIQRIDSALAGILIQKLAERLSSRPGRYGQLLVWVQWICVAHGGAIGGQPEVLKKIKTLYSVLNQRSKALDSLLLLKGKLDMLDAQLGLRKQLLSENGPVRNPDEGHVIYIEGEEDSDSGIEDAVIDENTTRPPTRKRKEKKNLHNLNPDNEEESEDEDNMPATNGVVAESEESDFDSEDDEESSVQQREGGLIGDEAEESDEDSHPSDREDGVSGEEDPSDDDKEDSEMDDFIDDGTISEAESASEISIDKMPEKPAVKKTRRL